ncbi:hypothetical protein D9M68_902200 [compost metagenome]
MLLVHFLKYQALFAQEHQCLVYSDLLQISLQAALTLVPERIFHGIKKPDKTIGDHFFRIGSGIDIAQAYRNDHRIICSIQPLLSCRFPAPAILVYSVLVFRVVMLHE